MTLVLFQIVWTNTHGTFLILPIMLSWTLICQCKWSRSDFFGLAIIGLSILINPYRWNVLPYVLDTRTRAMGLGINEWVPTTSYTYLTDVSGKPSLNLSPQFFAFWLLFAVFLGRILLSLWKKEWPRFLRSPYIVAIALAFSGLRNSAFCFYVLPIFLAHWSSIYIVSTRTKTPTQKPSVGILIISISMTIFAILASPYFKSHFRDFLPEKIQGDFDTSIPQISKDINLAGKPKCANLNDLSVGGYLMMTTPNPLLIDGRLTPFTSAGFDIYSKYLDGTGTEELVNRSRACFAVLNLYRTPKLIEQMTAKLGFHIIEKEEGYVLLGR